MKSCKYDILTDIEHTLKRPDTYIGDTCNVDKECYIVNKNSNCILKKTINYNAGFFKIISEIFANAIDNVIRSIGTQTECNSIKVNVSNNLISVYNNGMVIPLDIMTIENKEYYLPNIIFGMFKSGSNFNDDEYRYGTGRNGLGAKLTNIYSKEFTVEILNNNKFYKQIWKNNMKFCEPPEITEYKGKDCNYVKITWQPDFEKFNLEECFVDDQICHLRKLCYDMAGLLNNGIKVNFNDELIVFKTFKNYCDLYEGFYNKNNFILLENKYIESIKSNESTVYITPKLNTNTGLTISFINSLYTEKGGIHQDFWCEKILKEIIKKISKKNVNIDFKNLKPFLQFFNIAISCRLPNPTFDTQSKVKLTGFTADTNKKNNKLSNMINIDLTKTVNEILKWDIITEIKKFIERKNDDKFDADIKKQYKNVNIKDYDCANRCGTNKFSKYCSLFLCEGLSAKTYVIEGLNKTCAKKYMENTFNKSDELNNILKDNNFNGRDYIGIYPLTGIIMNSRNNNDDKLAKNKVISEISSILNLSSKTDYNNAEQFNKLPYGKVVILTDADEDGKHIKGLILNLFHNKYKSLLDKNYVITMNTPILKIKNNNKIILFYNEHLGRKYIENNKNDSSNVNYYKGLGTSSNEDIHASFGVNMQSFIYDNITNDSIVTMFDSGKADERKKLINNYVESTKTCHENLKSVEDYINNTTVNKNNPNIHIAQNNKKKISEFMQKDMVEFSYENCKRTIPNIMDGLKQSQRKILYGLFKKNLSYDKQVIKVAQLSGYVAEISNYHHGEQNLNDTIINMAKDCIGSNNIPLLYPSGQFGTRGENNAAAARYIFTKLNKLTKYIYKNIDNVLLEHVIDEGDKVEPIFYLPVIPMVLVNRIKGIGSGYSTDIQCYNVKKIIQYIKHWLINGTYLDITIEPWYRNFKGKITKLNNDKWEMTGTYIQERNIITITEIPVTVSINEIKVRLEELEKENKIVKYKNRSTAIEPIFDIQLNNADYNIYELIPKMKVTISTNNMQMFDKNYILTKFNTVYDIINYFMEERILYYEKRRLYIINTIKEELKKINNKYRFITSIIANSDTLFKSTYEKLLTYLKNNKYDLDSEGTYKYLIDIPARNFTTDQLEKLKKELDNKKKELIIIENKKDKDLWLEDLDELENEINNLI